LSDLLASTERRNTIQAEYDSARALDHGAPLFWKLKSIDPCTKSGELIWNMLFHRPRRNRGCCAVYLSLENKLVVVSFRGTCATIDLVTDASIVQKPWVEGQDPKKEGVPRSPAELSTTRDKDIAARMPRTVRALSVDYDHCGSTVLATETTQENADRVLWIEGESDDR
jgi:hypothetical protein